MPRLLIAIPVSDAYRTQLNTMVTTLGERLRSSVRWTRPDNWHMTLQFLGQVEEDNVGEIREALRKIIFPVFLMRAEGTGCFPNMIHPRVLWVGIEKGHSICSSLAETVQDTLEPFDFMQGKQFEPHFTLGRVKQLENDDFETVLASAVQDWPLLRVEHFSLWESKLTPDGPVYTVIENFPLQARMRHMPPASRKN